MAKQPLKKKEVKTSSFRDFKKSAGFNTNIADKPIEWLEMPQGFLDALHVNIPQGYVSIVAGHSHTGKSTLINHAITAAQRQGLIPVIYDTENNFDFSYVSDPTKGKMAPKWEGPYHVVRCRKKWAYHLMTETGKMLPRSWNAEHLKRYYM